MSIPLSRGIYCEDCEYVSESKGNCAVCGSSAVVNLQRLLEHKFEPEPVSIEELERMAK